MYLKIFLSYKFDSYMVSQEFVSDIARIADDSDDDDSSDRFVVHNFHKY